jgi:hypothetical protein
VDGDVEKSGKHLRFPITLREYPGSRAEIVLLGHAVILHELEVNTEIRLPVSDFVLRQGRMIQFCSRLSGAHGGIGFAGMDRDAWYHAYCVDEASAIAITEQIERLRAGFQSDARHDLRAYPGAVPVCFFDFGD